MAIGFDELDDYYTVADAAELTLPDNDWCVGVWTYVSDNVGANYQYLLGTNTVGTINSFWLYLQEATAPTPNCWTFYPIDGDGTTPGAMFAGATGADSTWRLIIAQRRTADNQIQLWFCTKGGVPSSETTAADTNFDAVNGSTWYIGARNDLDAGRFYGSIVCEIFKGNFSLTSAQIQALGGGLPIKTLAAQLTYTLDLWLPMWRADNPILDYSSSGNDGTRFSAPTTQSHAPICTPIKRHRLGG